MVLGGLVEHDTALSGMWPHGQAALVKTLQEPLHYLDLHQCTLVMHMVHVSSRWTEQVLEDLGLMDRKRVWISIGWLKQRHSGHIDVCWCSTATTVVTHW